MVASLPVRASAAPATFARSTRLRADCPVLPNCTVPELIAKLPLCVLAPVKASVPAPCLTIAAEPLRAPDSVWFAEVLKATVPELNAEAPV